MTGSSIKTAGQADALVQYNYKSGIYESNDNLKAAVIGELNILVPSAYKRITQGGDDTQMYWTITRIRKLRESA